ncbi:cytochrome c [Vibrio inusitatus NBRC 102082]|uniref:Cytochrome c n=1 Tax=Vibrio inusitatus NBRC 102082 TaxID=1219070 RepID=A0A4Y3HZH0_9VIBR|nr:c-type cytochrome [Vibrio inusitatus]GEA51624.1 cytochrome c [Vibrio inusitatus NBRC 102082]
MKPILTLFTLLFSLNAYANQSDLIEKQPSLPSVEKIEGSDSLFPYELSTIPSTPFGDKVKRGYQLMTNSQSMRNKYVFNEQNCTNCHLSSGRLPNAAPMGASFFAYPAYRSKNKHVNSYQERVQGCFRYSMNGVMPTTDSDVLVDFSAYAYWLGVTTLYNMHGLENLSVPELSDKQLLAGGKVDDFPFHPELQKALDKVGSTVETRAKMPGRGFPKLDKPKLTPDYERGELVFRKHCAACHGSDGQGKEVAGIKSLPPLWGKNSYNWGAGMHKFSTAAAFIYENMPLGKSVQLTKQQAWDVATFMNSHERPQDPRFKNSIAETKKIYQSKDSAYGETINGVTLGSSPLEEHHQLN